MNYIQLILFLLFCTGVSAQKVTFNTTLLSNVPINENCSDIWGYEKDGIKYAVIGSATKTSIFSLEDPKKPVLRYEAKGTSSIWRDIKSYKNHLYVTTDQGLDGLTIIDMSLAPVTITHSFFKPKMSVGLSNQTLEKCHNLYIDSKGFAYLAGCNISKGGVLIFDLNKDAKIPEYIGAADLNYAHDAYVKGDTLFASEVYIGKLGIYDISTKALPKLLATQTTSRTFTHNAWASDDGKYVFTTDEKSGAYVDAYDISDFNNIRLLDKFRPLERENDGVIPHNTHYHKGYLVTSWYTDGVRIVDVHKPDNMVEIAYYDTWEDPVACHSGFSGSWGAFPFTGSDIVYASDINYGLFIFNANYNRACYLEGKVTNSMGNNIINAKVEIVSDQINRKYTDPSGTYKTGQAKSGTFKVIISHPDYNSKEETIVLKNGEVTMLNVQLVSKVLVNLEVDIKDRADKNLAAEVYLTNNIPEYNFQSLNTSKLTKVILSGNYNLFVSKWGYKNYYKENFETQPGTLSEIVLTLDLEYEDNFETNQGWKVISTSGVAGAWVRGIPNQTEYINGIISNPGSDSDDIGKFAYITGNGIRGAACDDVDNGVTELVSPPMDLTRYSSPKLNYSIWFFNAGGTTPINDTLIIKLSDGQKEVVIDKIFGNTNGWLNVRGLDVKKYMTPSKEMNLIVSVSDQSGNQAHIVEAGFDHFYVTDQTSSLHQNVELYPLTIYPNPSSEYLVIRKSSLATGQLLKYDIFNQLGQMVKTGQLADDINNVVDVSQLAHGLYMIKVAKHNAIRFIKQ
ncbi:MAG: choice-of-anchor B family protein [Saprospiraceae bacterium]